MNMKYAIKINVLNKAHRFPLQLPEGEASQPSGTVGAGTRCVLWFQWSTYMYVARCGQEAEGVCTLKVCQGVVQYIYTTMQ